MGVQDHRSAAAGLGSFVAAVLTVSDSRREATDESGDAIAALAEAQGHRVGRRLLIKNDAEVVRQTVMALAMEVDLIITTGGTGISPKDLTIEACRPLLHKELEGFGELFRALSYQEIGSAAILSRATGGSIGRAVLFCLPGSTAAVKLAMERLILPELKHLIAQVRKV
jgi:molybdenum cofactor biosynthesis protein B